MAIPRSAAQASPAGCAVAEDGGDAGIGNGGIDDGLHIAAAAGDEDNDVFYGVGCRRLVDFIV